MMLMKQPVLMLCLLLALSILPVSAQEAVACDLDALLGHQQEHAASIADLEHALHTDAAAALEALYVTGVAYQALAIDCGFVGMNEAAAAHAAEHETEDEHDHTAVLEAARAIGDPENGEVLFNTLQPAVGFACATCHRVDTTERLIGPGLFGVGSPEHDPSAHEAEVTDTADGHAAHHTEATPTETPQSAGHAAHSAEEASVDPVEYIRTSILDPGAYLVPDFPDYLMPRIYGEIFTEAEIDDLIAYILTLQ